MDELRLYERERALQALLPLCPSVYWLDSVDSTNAFLARLEHPPHGVLALAETQSAGRGRMGRSFLSPPHAGLYLSLLLRPHLPPDRLLSATGMAAVAVRRGIARTTGLSPEIKWTNDLLLDGRKLCGILTQVLHTGNAPPALIIGVGINVRRWEFPPELAPIVTSLEEHTAPPSSVTLAAAVVRELLRASEDLGRSENDWVAEYRRHCITLGRPVRLLWTERQTAATALDIDEQFGLVVQLESGERQTVRTGEVSVRGLFGYAP